MCKKQRMPWEPEPTPRIYVPPMGMYVERACNLTRARIEGIMRGSNDDQKESLRRHLCDVITRRWSEVKADWLFLNAVGSYLGFTVDFDGVVEYTESRPYGDSAKT